MAFTRRWILVLILSLLFLFTLLHTTTVTHTRPAPLPPPPPPPKPHPPPRPPHNQPPTVDDEPPRRHWWKSYVERYPVKSMIPLPTGQPASIPQIQFDFPAKEDPEAKALREERREAVKQAFLRTWQAYKENAWMGDELGPVEGNVKQTFGGWGATLVDTLDTLWIMGLKDEFEMAVDAVRDIDFSSTRTVVLNVFETTIRYLGGFLAAYDISEGAYPVLLEKAVEVGDLLYVAFDTPNRLPVLRWPWKKARNGEEQRPSTANIIAELGSLSVEFTRLSQLTENPKYFDAVQRITDLLEAHQDDTKLPGLWPLNVNLETPQFSKEGRFTFGGMADSLYEYLPKEYLMLGGRAPQYKAMYEKAMDVAKNSLFYKPKTADNADILLSGYISVSSKGARKLHAEGQHLACFAGGMAAIGAKIFNRMDELEIGRKLTEGCIWAYRSMPSGIMPEIFRAVPCTKQDTSCDWDPQVWFRDSKEKDMTDDEIQSSIKRRRLIPGFLSVEDKRYLLRPEAIESIFILYRITGDTSLQDKGWDMFTAIEKATRTDLAYGAIDDVRVEKPRVVNEMESFWTGETLKYFYLLFSESDLVSLDRYVFNTEAHPLLRPV
ncbi:hypothetical protein VTO42DRAFT_3068 [Malbranchea cinnamomea]